MFPSQPSSHEPIASVSLKRFGSHMGDSLDLPSYESSAALEFIGFTPDAAHEIFARYTARPDPDQNCYGLLDYALSHIGLHTSDKRERLSMTTRGLSAATQDALTDPHFAAIAGMQEPLHWLHDTLRLNYKTLDHLQTRLAESETHSREPTTLAYHCLPAAHVSVGPAGPILPDHYVLYKATAACEMEGWIQEDANMEMGRLMPYRGGDFNRFYATSAWYPEKEFAEMQRRWMERRCPWTDTCLVRIQVPKAIMDGLRTEELWFGPDLKTYVWHCRKRKSLPREYDRYWVPGQAELIKAHICTRVRSFLALREEEVETAVTDDFVLRLQDGNRATQWVFMQADAVKRIGREWCGKMHIDITAAAQMQDVGFRSLAQVNEGS